MAKIRGLGRGLDALLAGDEERRDDTQTELPVGLLKPGRFQPRTRMDPESIAELSDSIKAQGVIQPILVRPVENGNFEIIAGERRWRASQLAGLTRVPVVIRTVPKPAQTHEQKGNLERAPSATRGLFVIDRRKIYFPGPGPSGRLPLFCLLELDLANLLPSGELLQ